MNRDLPSQTRLNRSELRQKNQQGLACGGRCPGTKGEEELQIEERVGLRLRRNTAALRQREGQFGRSAGSRQKRREVQAIAAKIMNAGTRLLGNSSCFRHVRIGMRHRAHLSNEKRQHSQGCDAKFNAMRPFEQGRPLTQESANASTVSVNREPPYEFQRASLLPQAMAGDELIDIVHQCLRQ
jgi:hypothetical protein